ncbi:hypothetical protein HY448_00020 [Candidatus Pacearchaeota archaeon]|nr:hypothetical protein [Candidatus Pacearchaeota archaeon]MBI5803062.1 hypothetical protein [Candidatus Pacearchaeota archaeon]
MNKWVIIGIIVILVLGIVIGIYVFQNSIGEQGSQNQGTDGTNNAPEIPGEILNGMFDALEQGLNQNG